MDEEKSWFGKAKYVILEGKEGIKKAYDWMADSYDYSKYMYWTRKIELGEERVLRKWMDRFSGICLDVGCGTGRYSLRAARKSLDVVALDFSLKMLGRLKEKARGKDIAEKIDVILSDGEHLPFREGVFSSLICTLTFDHFENSEQAAGEFSRVLRNGSWCVISTFNSYTLEEFQRRNEFGNKAPFRTEDMPPVLIYEVGHSAHEIEDMFLKYGLRIEDVKGGCYWHLFPDSLAAYYQLSLDSLFNLFKDLLKYAEIHLVLMKKA